MIFISSSSIKKQKIADAVTTLIENDFRNIELSGGTKYYDGWLDELMELKHKYQLNFLIHNYFPPPKIPFVFNLSSPNKEIAIKSIEHAKKAIDCAHTLEAKKIGFHAGFLIHIPVNQIGKKIESQELFDKEIALNNFIKNYNVISLYAKQKDIKLYIENNVLSKENYKSFQSNPFLFVTSEEIKFFKKKLSSFNYIFDYGHSYVSSKTLNLKAAEEFDRFIESTDYIHLSDNEGFSDSNHPIKEKSAIYNHLVRNPPLNKTVTLEIYEDISHIKKAYYWLSKLSKF